MFRNIPPVVKNLIIINALMFLITWVIKSTYQIELSNYLGFHYFESKYFHPYQLVTYMFMHGGFFHILLNMYALFMFGIMLEGVWGGKKFFIFYIFCGLGAIAFQALVNYIQFTYILHEFNNIANTLSIEQFLKFAQEHFPIIDFSPGSDNYNTIMQTSIEQIPARLNEMMQVQMSIPTVGASGAVFGILLAFGMLFPNLELMLLFPPIPIKAKWFVMIYGAFELYSGLSMPGDSVAHFAHLGGMLFGFILIKLWSKNKPKNLF